MSSTDANIGDDRTASVSGRDPATMPRFVTPLLDAIALLDEPSIEALARSVDIGKLASAWTWTYRGLIVFCNGEEGFQPFWDDIERVDAAMDVARATIWARHCAMTEHDPQDPAYLELDASLRSLRIDANAPGWRILAEDGQVRIGQIWIAILAGDAAALALELGFTDPERVLVAPWELTIGALPVRTSPPQGVGWSWPSLQ